MDLRLHAGWGISAFARRLSIIISVPERSPQRPAFTHSLA